MFHYRFVVTQQNQVADIIKIHAQQGEFSVVIGESGMGKRVLKEHSKIIDKDRENTVTSGSRTLHAYLQILHQPAESFKIEVPEKTLVKELTQSVFNHTKERKTLYILIDEAHLLDMIVLRKLRLLFGQLQKNNLILFGQRDLLHYLSLNVNKDIKSRITYSAQTVRQNDDDIERYIIKELEAVRMGINTFNESAIDLIIRSAQGNLRRCQNLCYGSLIEASRDTKKTVTISHVNGVLVQPYWRSHDKLIKQQVT